MNIAALGRSDILYNTIRFLYENDVNISLIVTCKESPENVRTMSDFERLANEINAEFLYLKQPTKINDNETIKYLKYKKFDLAISTNWQTIIKKNTINCFKNGVINAHMGDLPKYKGNATPNWAIINDEKNISLTLHFMTEELDSGDILLKKIFKIDENTYIKNIYDFAVNEYPKMFLSCINKIKKNKLEIKKQDSTNSIRCYPRIPSDGLIDWKLPAISINRLIHAVSEPFPGAYTYLDGEKMIIWESRVEPINSLYYALPGQVLEVRPNGELSIDTGDGVLIIENYSLKSEKGDVKIKRIRTRLGICYEEEINKLKMKITELEKIIGPRNNNES